MKKICILLFGLMISTTGISQSCLPEGITFTTQAQIDNFQANYPGCTEIEGDVTVHGLGITNLNGLTVLTAILGDLSIQSTYYTMTSLTGLGNLSQIGGSLKIFQSPGLINLTGLDVLTYIGGDLYIDQNGSLTSLLGLNNLTTIGDSLIIGDFDGGNPALTSLTGLGNVTLIGSTILINGNDLLASLAGLEGLTSIVQDILIYYNPALMCLTGLDNVTSIGGDLGISDNPALSGLTGLENLHSIGGDFSIGFNYSLNSLSSMENLNSIGDDLNLSYNDILTSLSGLDNLITVGGYLGISANENLTNLNGLEGLTSIGGLKLNHTSFVDLTGLDNLTSIGGGIEIQFNVSLTDLTALENIDANTITDLHINDNPFLSNCAIQSICNYLVDPNGGVEIDQNATGCNSEEEVKAACGVGIDESSVVGRQSSVRIYPNPSSRQITIETPTTPDKNTFLTISNLNGQELLSRQITQQQTVVDVAGLSPGIYFVKIISDDEVMVEKFVKE